jgi:hypothetical protein
MLLMFVGATSVALVFVVDLAAEQEQRHRD